MIGEKIKRLVELIVAREKLSTRTIMLDIDNEIDRIVLELDEFFEDKKNKKETNTS